ncbi:MAG TPA: AIR synthase-related protein, partial [Bacteroidia bacterium]|nr:AIR synthase-related protein [Bacteroidia bacterium]
ISDKNKAATLAFSNAGDQIFLIGSSKNCIASSQYLVSTYNVNNSPAPEFNLDEEYDVQQLIIQLIKTGCVQSVHDVSDGGLFISLLESAMIKGLGFEINSDEDIRKDAFLFGESQSRVVVSVSEEQMDEFISIVADSGVDFTNLGVVTQGEIIVDEDKYGNISEYSKLYQEKLESEMAH